MLPLLLLVVSLRTKFPAHGFLLGSGAGSRHGGMLAKPGTVVRLIIVMITMLCQVQASAARRPESLLAILMTSNLGRVQGDIATSMKHLRGYEPLRDSNFLDLNLPFYLTNQTGTLLTNLTSPGGNVLPP